MYLLKLALRPWRLTPLSQVGTAFAVTALLLAGAFLFSLEYGARPLIRQLEGEQVLTAYILPDHPVTKEGELVDSIRQALGSSAKRSLSINKIGMEEFLKEVHGRDPSLYSLLANLGLEAQSVIPRYISVSGLLAPESAKAVRAIPGIESVETSHERFKSVASAFSALAWVLRACLIGLGIAAITGLFHLARTNSFLFSETLHTLRLFGAGQLALRLPSLIAGLSVGMIAGVLAGVAWMLAAPSVFEQVGTLSPVMSAFRAPPASVAFGILFLGPLLGLMSGLMGSYAFERSKISRS